MNDEGKEHEFPSPERRQMPLWLRILLLALLVLVAAGAFYLNNLKIIEHLESR